MYIARMLFPVKNLGPGERLGIWVSGCKRNCRGCANPELRVQKPEQQISIGAVKKIFNMLPKPPAGITITGGEPFEQANELADLCEWLSNTICDDILVYTGYKLQQLKDKHDDNVERLLSQIAALVDGEYVEELNKGNRIKGSENQALHVFREQYRADFTSLDIISEGKRVVQSFLSCDGSIIATGFEKSNFNAEFSGALQDAVHGGGTYEKT